MTLGISGGGTKGILYVPEEIWRFYFQQRTEVVDDSWWMVGFEDTIVPAVDNIKRLLKLDKSSSKLLKFPGGLSRDTENEDARKRLEFNLDAFVREQISSEPTQLNIQKQPAKDQPQEGNRSYRRIRRPVRYTTSPLTA